ncbi:hypothetical protein SCLARK_001685 [Spiroplasma clarkii]|uniref:SnoaL-like domain-containing protein n=1 Tax=Spiroplasma clarkii TaxID=2139 RepID=A0A1Y0L391_9MOLU|nr:nuclear transport factor 2 family protein [Spiroplasma clarkii]ARU92149.1 hypothetical protein SCLARK_001685 [Spiroplasma clarkii]ATX71481.1 hypothetical protein SCLAR_v1c11810 [Spiroplasma clarkii]
MKNKEVVVKFFTALSKGDWKLMNNLYSKDVAFSDTVFGELNYSQITNLWEMLLTENPDLSANFKIVEDGEVVKVQWVMVSKFGQKHRKVILNILSTLEVSKGKIIKHNDHFDFKKWAKQALGIIGWMLGSKQSFKNRIKEEAFIKLNSFIDAKQSSQLGSVASKTSSTNTQLEK